MAIIHIKKMRQEDFESLNWLVVLSKGLISLKQLFWILFHFNVKKFVFSITSNTLVWQARAIENIGKHWSMPAGRQMLTWSNQFIEVKVGTASSTTLYNYYKQWKQGWAPPITLVFMRVITMKTGLSSANYPGLYESYYNENRVVQCT